ncbi:hypothetical protein [Armatimonas sp.]|uniref:hypothetical protein n=1 Tax=Armatimonas sp. TaxID=1872638 RepID=UPI00374D7588
MASLRTLVGAVAMLGATLPVAAQTPPGDPLPKGQERVSPTLVKPRTTERQSQLNPAGKMHGDTTNRGRMSADFLWGVTNANRIYRTPAFSRVPDQTLAAPLQLDGYTVPYPVQNIGTLASPIYRRQGTSGAGLTSNLLYPSRSFDDEINAAQVISVTHPVTTTGTVGGFFIGVNWSAANGPTPGGGAGYFNASYQRIAAAARSANALPDPGNPNNPDKFIWYPSVPGVAGTVTRYGVRIHIPEVDPGGAEQRITDARYAVYYVVPQADGSFVRKRKICFLGQDAAGDNWLLGDDGKPALFPFFSEATYSDPAWRTRTFSNSPLQFGNPLSRARVELDSSTEDELTGSQFVLADQISFEQRVASVKSTPVVTPPHGGRKVDTTQAKPIIADPNPFDQPAAGTNYGLDTWVPGAGFALLNDSFAFINNPRDTAYTTPVNPLFGKFDPANPSTLFRGPASLIDPRDAANLPTAPVNAVNLQQYKDGVGNVVPFFSHMQVLVNRTNYVLDPETGVPDVDKDGTKTIEVGSIFGLDWATGTVLWRFPDATYLPQLAGGASWRHPDNTLVAGAGLRNAYDAVSGINLIPGIGAYDSNGNGRYDDDEVYLVGQGVNPSGAVEGAPTIVPNMKVFGDVKLPVYTSAGGGRFDVTTVISAPLGRYVLPDPINPALRLPVRMPLAFIGGSNGVLYAIDPFGNNDNQYIERANPASLGEFRPGTTNLLWTFSPTSAPRVTTGLFAEPLDKYYFRLKGEIPVPGSFGASSPVVTWAKQDDDDSLNRLTEEPRLFIGNQNNAIYALDPRADAGADLAGNPMPLPIRKGEQVAHTITQYNTPGYLRTDFNYRTDLKWWFETLGVVASTLAVSDVAFARNLTAAPVTASRRVFATTTEGRIYSLDWDGPVTKVDHEKNMVWDGSSGVESILGPSNPPVPTTRPLIGSAAALNDNVRFHNQVPARPGARPDKTEGTIRPVWAFPSRYADIADDGGAPVDNVLDDPNNTDYSRAYPGTKLASASTNIAPIYSAPVVMDFAIRDTDSAVAGLTGIRRYLVISTNDYDADTPSSPKQGRLLLLDQEGDRNDFLSNPMPSVASAKFIPNAPAVNTARPSGPTAKPTPTAAARITGQALDEFVWKDAPFGKASPVWTYRFVYDTYDAITNKPIISRRNRPTPGVISEPVTLLPAPVAGEPGRRTLPTIFWGGQGRLFAVDLDDETGLLLRWRRSTDPQQSPIPLDGSVPIPADLTLASDYLNPSDVNNPFSPIFNVGAQDTLGLRTKRVMARTVKLRGDGSAVDGQLVVTGGPLQNRNNSTAITAANALPNSRPAPLIAATDPTVPLIPTLDAPITKPILTFEPQVIVDPIGPIIYDLNPFGFDLDLTFSLAPAALFPAAIFLPIVDMTGRFVNQDIGDPLTTTRGTWDGVAPPVIGTDDQNLAYQYPSLLVTTALGALHQLSTNIEGEDPSAATDPNVNPIFRDNFAALGWSLTEGNIDRYNTHDHVLLFSKDGPGGAGTGISVVTNAYFPSLDSGYARRKDRLTKQTAPMADPSGKYVAYPTKEPQALTSLYGDGPRPGFQARPLYSGNPADGTTTPPTALVDPDWNTGQTGFPLDLHGLFYDKRHATATATNHNVDGKLKLPAYDQQGVFSTTPPVATGVPETNLERASHKLLATADANDNPAGQNVAWIFVGGEDGLFYAYTPVFRADLGGVASGYAGGRDNSQYTPGMTAQARVDTFDVNTYTALRNAARSGIPIRPDRDGNDAAWVNGQENTPLYPMGQGAGRTVTDASRRSVAAQGSKNLYEWGETIYIVAWDLTVVTSDLTGAIPIPTDATASIRIRALNSNVSIPARAVRLERATMGAGAGRVSVYPYVGRYSATGDPTPPGARPAQLGLAFYEFRLDTSSGLPLTPGMQFEVDIEQGTPLGYPGNGRISTVSGGTTAEQSLFMKPILAVANPLAVQGFLADTRTNLPLLANKAVGAPVAGGIGPFVTPAQNDALHTVRQRVASNNPTTAMDPDLAGYEYSQALSNGNTITRYDFVRYTADAMGVLRINNNFSRRLRTNGSDDPSFFVPVATSTGYISHGRTGSTDLSTRQRNLRVVNRTPGTLALTGVRAEVADDLIWRWWPGRIPNADVDLSTNPAITPAGMHPDGRINPLPWEQNVPQAQPWKRRPDNTVAVLGGNLSPDYPDIIAASAAQQGRQAVSVLIAGTDAVQGPVTLPSAQLINPINGALATRPYDTNPLFAATVNVRVPQYQPANLVATHSLTSTYEAPSTSDGAQPYVGEGKTQLPRGLAGRDLRQYNQASNVFTGGYGITPFGYSSRLRVFVDNGSGNAQNNNNGRWDDGEPFRFVEVWAGVPVDMGLKSAETPLDLGALPAGFGIQNGLMGYQYGSASNPGVLPDPIGRLAPTVAAPYDKFFKKMTIQNIGNVNLYNLRAAQTTQQLTTNDVTDTNNFRWSYFGLTSETVDSRYGIMAVAADPALTVNPGYTPAQVMPQVVTSLDRAFDAAWVAYLANPALPATAWMHQPNVDDGNGGFTTAYLKYYAMMAGRHTLHKPQVGGATPAVLSDPDLPPGTALVPNLPGIPQPQVTLPALGVAVPIGTPVGVYRSLSTAGATAPPALAVFEDHDTVHPNATPTSSGLLGYMGVPTLIGGPLSTLGAGGGSVTPAGPLYAGRNDQPPGLGTILPATLPIPATLRVRNFAVNGVGQRIGVEFQPHTNPAIDVKLTVSETSALTGQIADAALAVAYDGIFSGLLPGIDTMPLMEGAYPNWRPASVTTPAAYRGANGRLNVYFARNAGTTAAGASFDLFRSHLDWDATVGAFRASAPGVPLLDPNSNAGRLFTQAAAIATNAGDSNLYPSVLQVAPMALTGVLTPEATLFWVNSQRNAGSLPTDTIYYSRLDQNGEPIGTPRSLLSTFSANSRPDPTIRRYGPRAAFDPTTRTGIVSYYGGAPGKLGLYYIPYSGDPNGEPQVVGGRRGSGEVALAVPPGITTASEPSATTRRLVIPDHSVGTYAAGVFTPTVNTGVPVLDIVYTGVLRNTQTPDIFLSRYRFLTPVLNGVYDLSSLASVSGRNTRLALTALPQIDGERLVQVGRELAWRSRHIAWYVRGQVDPADSKFTTENLDIRVVRNGVPVYATSNKAWQYDNNSRRWVQVISGRPGGVVYIYVDADTGEVRFRGADEPQSGDTVLVSYQPTTYRLTPDAAGDTGAVLTEDYRALTADAVSQVYRHLMNGAATVIPSRETNPLASGLGRQWLTWSKAAQPNRPARLYFTARRMGIDLRSVVVNNGLARGESILLGARDLTPGLTFGNQLPQVSSVLVGGIGPVSYDVDFATGRIFVDPLYEGLDVVVNYTASQGATSTNRRAKGRLSYIEELAPSDTYSMGLQVPMQQTVNEGQSSIFVDLYNYDPSRPDLLRQYSNTRIPGYQGDPTLQPGKLWMFWTSSRPRTGLWPLGGNLVPIPNGFELFYQTIAPRFEAPSFSGFGQ